MDRRSGRSNCFQPVGSAQSSFQRHDISFYNSTTVNEMWDKTDIFITADIDIIESKPDGKELIIVNRVYNDGHECDMRIDSLKQIKSFEEIYELEE